MEQSVRKTKIVCTLGPATSSPEMIEKMIAAGMNVARLNFSHGSYESHANTYNSIRKAAERHNRHVGILQDLSGPKIRLGELPREIILETGQEVLLGASGGGADGKIFLPVGYPYLYEDVQIENRILLADGLVEFKVVDKRDRTLVCQVTAGGVLSSHKGVNLPTSNLRIPAFTDKDKEDLEVGLKLGVDFVAMSFVRHEDDVKPVKQRLIELASKTGRQRPLLIAKIEKPQALERFSQILSEVDGIMVARGDLGVEMPLEQVPVIQKRLIREARRAGKVVITATQMLRSMIDNPRPTRAEANDVANAILDGTDAVMLSEESAVGSYPVEAVLTLDRVARATEPDMADWRFLDEQTSGLLSETSAAISHAVCLLARDLNPAVIVATTHSGSTARLISLYRPPVKLMGLSSSPEVCRQLCLSWGVDPVINDNYVEIYEIIQSGVNKACQNGFACPGDKVIVTTGFPLGTSGGTNLIKVSVAE
ncbi:MAG: pyruvate kinase [Desulfarculales bacterium]|nr:pyruvate kinase [Desulfarculales bacterium]